MEKLYKYTGGVSSMSYRGRGNSIDIILSELGNDEKAPIWLEAHGAMAKYIREIEMTDAEERYIDATYFYDSGLNIHRIEIPSTDERHPAKIICSADFLSTSLAIFGPAEYIETSTPGPMSKEQYTAWRNFRNA